MPVEPRDPAHALAHLVPVAVAPAARVDDGAWAGPARYRETGGCVGAAKLLALAAAGYVVLAASDQYCSSLHRPYSAVIEARDGRTYLAVFRGERRVDSPHVASMAASPRRARAF